MNIQKNLSEKVKREAGEKLTVKAGLLLFIYATALAAAGYLKVDLTW